MDFEQWRPALVRYLAARGSPDPDDAVQEAWIRCHRAEQRGQVVTRPYAFIAARSAMLDQIQAQWRRDPRPIEYLNLTVPDPTDDLPDPADLARRLDTLTERQRQVLLLSAEGLKQEQIAERIGATIDAVKKLKMRGIAAARRAA